MLYKKRVKQREGSRVLAKVTVAVIGDFGECLQASTRSAEHVSGMLSSCHSQFLQPILQGSEYFKAKMPEKL